MSTAEIQKTESAFPETADIETSSDEYATRFAGPAGEWMLSIQERITQSLLLAPPGTRLLDVGGGHGQLAIPLHHRGYPITILSSHESCRKRVADILTSGTNTFQIGNVIQLPFPDRSFDTVLCFRLLTHCERFPKLVSELCRVAAHTVIADYPTSQSINAIAPALFGTKKKLEKNTRPWRLFRHREVREEFLKNGFQLDCRKAQFFFPMVLHRMLKCRTLSAFMEGIARGTGLTAMGGSPVIIRMTRKTERK